MKLQKKPVVRIVKRHNRRTKAEPNQNRQRNSESETKKTVESWIDEFKRKRIECRQALPQLVQS